MSDYRDNEIYRAFMQGSDELWSNLKWQQPDDVPNLTPEEFQRLYETMGGAQLNDFIKQNYRIKKDTTLPGGSYIPTPDYLELEPGTTYWQYDKKKPHDDLARKEYRRTWDEEVSRAKVLYTEVQEIVPNAKKKVPHMPQSRIRRSTPRKDLLLELTEVGKEAGYTLLAYIPRVRKVRRKI